MKRLNELTVKLEPLEQEVATYVHEWGLFADSGRVLLAISGGADSIALLYVMDSLVSRKLLSIDLVCAHINHSLRDSESDGDESFVVRQAKSLGLPVSTQTIDVRAHARATKLSIETAGRDMRLAALAQIACEHSCTSIATGHQKNDNAETVVHRILRGTGFRGLGGIWPVRQLGDGLILARPLLCASREQITTYLQGRGVPWREDRTNSDCAHTRNHIRHRLMPAIQATCPGDIADDLGALAIAAQALHRRIEREAEQAWGRLVRPTADRICIDTMALAALAPPVAIELMRRALARIGGGEKDMTRRHYRAILELANPKNQKKTIVLPQAFVVRREAKVIVIEPLRQPSAIARHEFTSEIELQVPGITTCAGYDIEARVVDASDDEVTKVSVSADPYQECLDFDSIAGPLVARRRRPGDRFCPLGLGAEKRVGKFLSAAGTPRDVRGRITIVEDAEKVVWLCPIRISDRVKITRRTRRILVLKAIEPEGA